MMVIGARIKVAKLIKTMKKLSAVKSQHSDGECEGLGGIPYYLVFPFLGKRYDGAVFPSCWGQ